MYTIEALQDAQVTVEILKVKAHVGIVGNEQADKAAKQACEDGEYVQPWDNDKTVLLRAMATDQDNVKYPLTGKNAVQTYVTKMIPETNGREPAVQRWNKILTGKPTEWVRRNAPLDRGMNQQTQEQELEDMLELEREVGEDVERDPQGWEGEDGVLLEMMEQPTTGESAGRQDREQQHQSVIREE
ncbi:hypothetical protein CYMTET_12502 [Cymbomonas tetramitiformis]|uniref:RNase H type-1 domain-containing protein n=1 Tax=Cymbomonas tetramitiformis TaxID=36881 RepID=A0AAE0GK17_9CHLO|nr:hypothetical protein CYMTET_12502 [Cymbomonas tetramitiformis]